MNLIEQLFNDFSAKYLEEAKNKGVDLGLQAVYTPIDKIEKATGFRFADYITAETRSVAVLFNNEFINYFIKELPQNYINNIKFTFFYDCEFDYKQIRNCIFFFGNKLNIEMIPIENIKDLNKVMTGKKFDIVFSNPPYNDGLDLKILSNIKNTFKKAIIVHPAVWILENKCVGYIGKFKKEFQNNIEKVVIFRGSEIFGVPFMSALDICVFNTEKLDSKIEVDDQVVNCKYIANNHIDITQYGDMWFKLNIKKFIEKFDPEKSILRHVYFDRDHLENLTYPIKLSECRSGNPHFNDGYYDEKLGYYVLNKTNCFFTCIAKGDPEKYHFNCDWTNKHNTKLLFNFVTANERTNFYIYAKSKFFRFMLSIFKVNMQNSNGSISGITPTTNLDSYPMKLIPWLDFTQEWNDAKLCKEFGISEELWNYIDNFIPDYYDDYVSGF